MKNTIKFIKPILAAAVILTGVSCEKFLTTEPIDKVEAKKFFASENELLLYANGLMNSYTPDALEVGIEGDRYCDFVCTKTSQDYNRPGVWGSNTVSSRKSVVFPEPLRPTSPTMVFSGTVSVTSSAKSG